MTSSFHVMDLKGNVFGRAMLNPSNLIVKAYSKNLRVTLRASGLKGCYQVPKSKTKPDLNKALIGKTLCNAEIVL